MRKRAVRISILTFLLTASLAATFFLWDIQRRTVELASADEPVVVGGVLSEIERQVPRLLGFDHFARRVPDFGLDAAAADGARHRPIFADQKLGAFVGRNRAVDLNDGGQRRLLPEPAKPHDFVEDVHLR